jgi:hypothetical protein
MTKTTKTSTLERWASISAGDRFKRTSRLLRSDSKQDVQAGRRRLATLRAEMVAEAARKRPACRIEGTLLARAVGRIADSVLRAAAVLRSSTHEHHAVVCPLLPGEQADFRVIDSICYPYKGAYSGRRAATTSWAITVSHLWSRQTKALGARWVRDSFILSCSPRAEVDGVEYWDAIVAEQGRGFEIRTQTGIIAVDRGDGLRAFGRTMEAARRSLYSTAEGRAVVARRREEAKTAKQHAREVKEAQQAAREVAQAAEVSALLASLPAPRGGRRAGARAVA